jgi:hypothetical protein
LTQKIFTILLTFFGILLLFWRMKRKKQHRKSPLKICADCRFNKHSLVLGLIGDLVTLIKGLVSLIAWPVRTLSKVVRRQYKHTAFGRWKHAHSVLCVAFGLALLGLTFTIEALSKHPAWSATIETMRAAGVCPVWETLSRALKFGADFEI